MINDDKIKQLHAFDEAVRIYTGSFDSMVNTIYLLFLKYAMTEKLNANTPEKLMALIDLQNSTHNIIDASVLRKYLVETFKEYDENFSFTGALYNVYEKIGFDNLKIWNMLWSLNQLDSEILSNFISYKILSGGRMSLEYVTNPTLAKLGVSLLNPSEKAICYDPFAGTGNILSAFPQNAKLIGNDLNPNSIIITQIRMIIDEKNSSLSCGDSFDIQKKNFADYVFSDGPLAGVLYDYEKVYSDFPELTPSKEVNLASIVCSLSSLNENGRGVIHVPTGVLFRETKSYKDLRKYLLKHNMLDAIIEFPSICYGSAVKTALLVVSKKRNENQVVFVNAECFVAKDRNVNNLTEEGIKSIVDIVNNKQEVKNVSAIKDYRDLLVAGEPLMVNRYIKIEDSKNYRDINAIDEDICEVWKELQDNMKA